MAKRESFMIGKLKDRSSLIKAKIVHTLISPKAIKFINLALLKSTTHSSHEPPNSVYVSDVLSYSNGPYASAAFIAALWRLRVTRSVFVAIKSLIVIHKLMKSSRDKFEGFDRGRNNLKLDDFCDKSSDLTLELSQWVNWYGQYLDLLSWISEVLGIFPNLSESSKEIAMEKDIVLSYRTGYIMRQTSFLVNVFEHICNRPETPPLYQNKIVDEIRELVSQDCFAIMRLVMVRLQVLRKRLITPVEKGVTESGLEELDSVLVRIEECKGRLSDFFWSCKGLRDEFWCLVKKFKTDSVKEIDEWDGLGQQNWITFEDSETAIVEVVKWNEPVQSTWITFDD